MPTIVLVCMVCAAMASLLSLDVEVPDRGSSRKREKKKKRIARRDMADNDVMRRGVIYVGRLPHGFYETQLKEYFSQFGTVTKVHVSRNKKTGNCRGYGFVEFGCDEVAKIAAQTMNNYLMFNKLLKCQFVDPERVHKGMFGRYGRRLVREVKASRRRQLAQRNHNRGRSLGEHRKRVTRLIRAEEKKREKLESLGIDYDFPGYKALSGDSAHHIPPKHMHFEDNE